MLLILSRERGWLTFNSFAISLIPIFPVMNASSFSAYSFSSLIDSSCQAVVTILLANEFSLIFYWVLWIIAGLLKYCY